eukprot:1521315-Rhodomonas_salina.1
MGEFRGEGVEPEEQPVCAAYEDAHLERVACCPHELSLCTFGAPLQRDALPDELHWRTVLRAVPRKHATQHFVDIWQRLEAGHEMHGQYETLPWQRQGDRGPCDKEVAVDLELCAGHPRAQIVVQGAQHRVDVGARVVVPPMVCRLCMGRGTFRVWRGLHTFAVLRVRVAYAGQATGPARLCNTPPSSDGTNLPCRVQRQCVFVEEGKKGAH